MHFQACSLCAIAIAFSGVWAERNELEKKGHEKINLEGRRPRKDGQHVIKSIILKTAVTVAYPRITQAPLLRRKLGSLKWDQIHEGIQGQKRDLASCPVDFQMCPQSMKGGCCPNDRVCGTSSCYAASAAPASACGKANYIACGINDGGGCCPSNYVCGRAGCTPQAGVSNTETCGVNSYLCPASLNFGCCKNGMGCGISNCYSTEIIAVTLTQTVETTESGSAKTLMSTVVTSMTPQPPVALPSTSGVLPKATAPPAPAITKTSASKASGSDGLTPLQIGFIIGAALTILVIIVTVTFYINRKLNDVRKAVRDSRQSYSDKRSRRSGPKGSQTRIDIDELSLDQLIMSPSVTSHSDLQQPSQPSATHSDKTHELRHHTTDSIKSPPLFGSPFSPGSPRFFHHSGYTPLSSSDTSSGYRNPSLDSTPGHHQGQSYFDIPPRVDTRDQNLWFGHLPRRPSRHERQWSESSDQSVASSGGLPELDSDPNGDYTSNFQRALRGMGVGVGRLMSRRRGSNSLGPRGETTPGGPIRKHEYTPNLGGLGHIPEGPESTLDIQEMGSGTYKHEIGSGTYKHEIGSSNQFRESALIDLRERQQGSAGRITPAGELLREVDLS